MIDKANFYDKLDVSRDEEKFTDILNSENIRIERIVSFGQSSPNDFWYEQDENEWVMLLSGSAVLEFEGGGQLELKKDEYVLIPAMMKHRVHSTSESEATIWLAVFFK